MFFIHLPVWAMGTFAIGAAYHSVRALTGRDAVRLTPRRELLFWVTILAIMGTLWHPKVTVGPPVYIGAVVVLLAIAVFKVFEFAGAWFLAALRRLTDPGYALVRNYFVAGIRGFGVAAVIGTVLTVDPVNSRIFPEGVPGGQAGTLGAAVHGMQGMLTGLTPLLMGVGYLVARWALGARLTPARLGNWVLAGLLIGSYGFLTAMYLAGQAGWMTSVDAQGQGSGRDLDRGLPRVRRPGCRVDLRLLLPLLADHPPGGEAAGRSGGAPPGGAFPAYPGRDGRSAARTALGVLRRDRVRRPGPVHRAPLQRGMTAPRRRRGRRVGGSAMGSRGRRARPAGPG